MASDSRMQEPLSAVIFDVDGVIMDSPHERAWRGALAGFTDPRRLTSAIYQEFVAGKPRLAGAQAALERLGVPHAAERAVDYAACKQKRLAELIHSGEFRAFPDALRFIRSVRLIGWRIAAASSSKNANGMMQKICIGGGRVLLDEFDANLCGRDLRRGKPDPEIFLLAAQALRAPPARCLVVEDAPAGIQAAKAAGMLGLGVARHGDAALLHAAQADLVVASLDEVDLSALARGVLRAWPIREFVRC